MNNPKTHRGQNIQYHEASPRDEEMSSKKLKDGAIHGKIEEIDDQIDLKELILFFWDKRLVAAKITGFFILLGIAIALFSQVEYQANATLLSEAQTNQSNASSLLQQYGGLLGFGGGQNTMPEGTIPPQLYPDVVQSLPYLVELMNKEIHFASYDTTVTVHTFFNEIHEHFSLTQILKGYTIGLPGKIIGLFKSDTNPPHPLVTKVDRDSILSLSNEQMNTANALRERLAVNVNQETGVISVSAEFPDPMAAADILQAGITLLKDYMRDYRTRKAQNDLEFVQEQVEKAKNRFEEAQNKLAEFRDSNLNLATAKAQTRGQELQSQYELAFNLYNSLSQQLQQNQLQVQEQTPVFSILQPVSVPLSKSAPNRTLIVIVSGILGVIAASGWILISNWWKNEPFQFVVQNENE